MSIFNHYQSRYELKQQEEYSLQEYLELCRDDPSTFASASERLLSAIGEPEVIDTSRDCLKGSPVNESPLGLFDPVEDGTILEEDFGIPLRYVQTIMSPWAVKRLHEYGGDISQFRVVKVYPSILDQTSVSKTEPGDENNQDISALVGKVDIRRLEDFPQNDPADSYTGK